MQSPFLTRFGLFVPKDKQAIMPYGKTIDRTDTPNEGTFRGNTDTNAIEMYLNGNWVSIGSTGLGVGRPIIASKTINDQGYYPVDNAGGETEIVITLDAEPNVSDRIILLDIQGTWSKAPITVDGNGFNINGIEGNVEFGVNFSNIELMFLGADIGWRAFATTLDAPGVINADPQITDFTAENKYNYPVDTTAASRNVLLPANPRPGDEVMFFDYANTWALASMMLLPNGSNIMRNSTSLELNLTGSAVIATYIDDSYGWLVKVMGKPKANAALSSGGVLTGVSILTANLFYIADTSVAGFEVTLPDTTNLTVGDTIIVADVLNQWGINPITINNNGARINNVVDKRSIGTAGLQLSFRFENEVTGWVMTSESLNPEFHYGAKFISEITESTVLTQPGIYTLNHSSNAVITLPAVSTNFVKVVINDENNLLEAHNVSVSGGANKINQTNGVVTLQLSGTKAEFVYRNGNWFGSIQSANESIPETKMTLAETAAISDFEANTKVNYPVNTEASPVTATLPLDPSTGDTISFFDYKKTWGDNGFTINSETDLFAGESMPYTFTNSGQAVALTYINNDIGWVDLNSIGDTGTRVEQITTDGRILEVGHLYAVTVSEILNSLKLPLDAKPGEKIAVLDITNSFRFSPIEIDAQDSFIDGSSSKITYDNSGVTLVFEFIDQTFGWKSSIVYGNAPRRLVQTDLTIYTDSFDAMHNTSHYFGELTGDIAVTMPDPKRGDVVEFTDTSNTLGRPYKVYLVNEMGTFYGNGTKNNLSSPGGHWEFEFVGGDQGWILRSLTELLAWHDITPTAGGANLNCGTAFNVRGVNGGKLLLDRYAPVGSKVILRHSTADSAPTIPVLIECHELVTVDGKGSYPWYDSNQTLTLTRSSVNWEVTREVNPDSVKANVVTVAGSTLVPFKRNSVATTGTINNLKLPNVADTALWGNSQDIWLEVNVTDTSSSSNALIVKTYDATKSFTFDRGYDFVRFEYVSGKWTIVAQQPEQAFDFSRTVTVIDEATEEVPSNSTGILLGETSEEIIRLGNAAPGESIRIYTYGYSLNQHNFQLQSPSGQMIMGESFYDLNGYIEYIDLSYISGDYGWAVVPKFHDANMHYVGLLLGDTSVSPNSFYTADTSLGPITATLPTNVRLGSMVGFKDYNWSFATNGFVISGLIDGENTTYTSITPGNHLTLMYVDDVIGWTFTSNDEVTEDAPFTASYTASNEEIAVLKNGGINIISVTGAIEEARHVYLPSGFEPMVGTTIVIQDDSGTWAEQPWLLGSTVYKLNGSHDSIRVETNSASIRMIYTGSDFGWTVDISSRLETVVKSLAASGTVDIHAAKTVVLDVDTVASPITITVPNNPVIGQLISFNDVGRYLDINNATVSFSGKLYNGNETDLILNTATANLLIRYVGGNKGWVPVSTATEGRYVSWDVSSMASMPATKNTHYNVQTVLGTPGIVTMPDEPSVFDFFLVSTAYVYEPIDFEPPYGMFETNNYATVIPSAHPVMGSYGSLNLDRLDVAYKFVFTGLEWNVELVPYHEKTIEDSDNPYMPLVEQFIFNNAIDAQVATITDVSLCNRYIVVDTTNGPINLVLDDTFTNVDIANPIRLVLYDRNGTLNTTSRLSITVDGINHAGINEPGNGLIISTPYSYIELEFNPNSRLWFVTKQFPEVQYDRTISGGNLNSNSTLATNHIYTLVKPTANAYTLTLPVGVEGQKVTLVAPDGTYSNKFTVRLKSSVMIDGRSTNADGYNVQLRMPTCTLILTFSGGRWVISSTVESLELLTFDVGSNITNNVLVTGAVNQLRTSGGSLLLLPENVPHGAVVHVEPSAIDVNSQSFTVHTREDLAGTSYKLTDFSVATDFTYLSNNTWHQTSHTLPGVHRISRVVSANTTIQAGTVSRVDTTSSPVTITLPDVTDLVGTTRVMIADAAEYAGTNAITVIPQGDTLINRSASDVMNQDGAWLELTHYEGVNAWFITGRYPPKDVILPQMTEVQAFEDFTAKTWSSYEITSPLIRNISLPTGEAGDIFVIRKTADAGSAIILNGQTVNGQVTTVLSAPVADYYFEYVDGLGWIMQVSTTVYPAFTEVVDVLSDVGPATVTDAAYPNNSYVLTTGALGGRFERTLDVADFVDGQVINFSVLDTCNAHYVVQLINGSKIDGTTFGGALTTGETWTLVYVASMNQFKTTTRTSNNGSAGIGRIPEVEGTAVEATLGVTNIANDTFAGESAFTLPAATEGALVYFGDPSYTLNYTTKIITITPSEGKTINGEASFNVTDPGEKVEARLIGNDWKVKSYHSRPTASGTITTSANLFPGTDYSIGTLITDVVVTLPDLDKAKHDHVITLIDSSNSLETYPLVINASGAGVFHTGATNTVFGVKGGVLRLRHRAVDNVWVIESLSNGSGSSSGGSAGGISTLTVQTTAVDAVATSGINYLKAADATVTITFPNDPKDGDSFAVSTLAVDDGTSVTLAKGNKEIVGYELPSAIVINQPFFGMMFTYNTLLGEWIPERYDTNSFSPKRISLYNDSTFVAEINCCYTIKGGSHLIQFPPLTQVSGARFSVYTSNEILSRVTFDVNEDVNFGVFAVFGSEYSPTVFDEPNALITFEYNNLDNIWELVSYVSSKADLKVYSEDWGLADAPGAVVDNDWVGSSRVTSRTAEPISKTSERRIFRSQFAVAPEAGTAMVKPSGDGSVYMFTASNPFGVNGGATKIMTQGTYFEMSGSSLNPESDERATSMVYPVIGNVGILDSDYLYAAENEYFIVDKDLTTDKTLTPYDNFAKGNVIVISDKHRVLGGAGISFVPNNGDTVEGEISYYCNIPGGTWTFYNSAAGWVLVDFATNYQGVPFVNKQTVTANTVLENAPIATADAVNVVSLDITNPNGDQYVKLPTGVVDGTKITIELTKVEEELIIGYPISLVSAGTDTIAGLTKFVSAYTSHALVLSFEDGNWSAATAATNGSYDGLVTTTVPQGLESIVAKADTHMLLVPEAVNLELNPFEVSLPSFGYGSNPTHDVTIKLTFATQQGTGVNEAVIDFLGLSPVITQIDETVIDAPPGDAPDYLPSNRLYRLKPECTATFVFDAARLYWRLDNVSDEGEVPATDMVRVELGQTLQLNTFHVYAEDRTLNGYGKEPSVFLLPEDPKTGDWLRLQIMGTGVRNYVVLRALASSAVQMQGAITGDYYSESKLIEGVDYDGFSLPDSDSDYHLMYFNGVWYNINEVSHGLATTTLESTSPFVGETEFSLPKYSNSTLLKIENAPYVLFKDDALEMPVGASRWFTDRIAKVEADGYRKFRSRIVFRDDTESTFDYNMSTGETFKFLWNGFWWEDHTKAFITGNRFVAWNKVIVNLPTTLTDEGSYDLGTTNSGDHYVLTGPTAPSTVTKPIGQLIAHTDLTSHTEGPYFVAYTVAPGTSCTLSVLLLLESKPTWVVLNPGDHLEYEVSPCQDGYYDGGKIINLERVDGNAEAIRRPLTSGITVIPYPGIVNSSNEDMIITYSFSNIVPVEGAIYKFYVEKGASLTLDGVDIADNLSGTLTQSGLYFETKYDADSGGLLVVRREERLTNRSNILVPKFVVVPSVTDASLEIDTWSVIAFPTDANPVINMPLNAPVGSSCRVSTQYNLLPAGTNITINAVSGSITTATANGVTPTNSYTLHERDFDLTFIRSSDTTWYLVESASGHDLVEHVTTFEECRINKTYYCVDPTTLSLPVPVVGGTVTVYTDGSYLSVANLDASVLYINGYSGTAGFRFYVINGEWCYETIGMGGHDMAGLTTVLENLTDADIDTRVYGAFCKTVNGDRNLEYIFDNVLTEPNLLDIQDGYPVTIDLSILLTTSQSRLRIVNKLSSCQVISLDLDPGVKPALTINRGETIVIEFEGINNLSNKYRIISHDKAEFATRIIPFRNGDNNFCYPFAINQVDHGAKYTTMDMFISPVIDGTIMSIYCNGTSNIYLPSTSYLANIESLGGINNGGGLILTKAGVYRFVKEGTKFVSLGLQADSPVSKIPSEFISTSATAPGVQLQLGVNSMVTLTSDANMDFYLPYVDSSRMPANGYCSFTVVHNAKAGTSKTIKVIGTHATIDANGAYSNTNTDMIVNELNPTIEFFYINGGWLCPSLYDESSKLVYVTSTSPFMAKPGKKYALVGNANITLPAPTAGSTIEVLSINGGFSTTYNGVTSTYTGSSYIRFVGGLAGWFEEYVDIAAKTMQNLQVVDILVTKDDIVENGNVVGGYTTLVELDNRITTDAHYVVDGNIDLVDYPYSNRLVPVGIDIAGNYDIKRFRISNKVGSRLAITVFHHWTYEENPPIILLPGESAWFECSGSRIGDKIQQPVRIDRRETGIEPWAFLPATLAPATTTGVVYGLINCVGPAETHHSFYLPGGQKDDIVRFGILEGETITITNSCNDYVNGNSIGNHTLKVPGVYTFKLVKEDAGKPHLVGFTAGKTKDAIVVPQSTVIGGAVTDADLQDGIVNLVKFEATGSTNLNLPTVATGEMPETGYFSVKVVSNLQAGSSTDLRVVGKHTIVNASGEYEVVTTDWTVMDTSPVLEFFYVEGGWLCPSRFDGTHNIISVTDNTAFVAQAGKTYYLSQDTVITLPAATAGAKIEIFSTNGFSVVHSGNTYKSTGSANIRYTGGLAGWNEEYLDLNTRYFKDLERFDISVTASDFSASSTIISGFAIMYEYSGLMANTGHYVFDSALEEATYPYSRHLFPIGVDLTGNMSAKRRRITNAASSRLCIVVHYDSTYGTNTPVILLPGDSAYIENSGNRIGSPIQRVTRLETKQVYAEPWAYLPSNVFTNAEIGPAYGIINCVDPTETSRKFYLNNTIQGVATRFGVLAGETITITGATISDYVNGDTDAATPHVLSVPGVYTFVKAELTGRFRLTNFVAGHDSTSVALTGTGANTLLPGKLNNAKEATGTYVLPLSADEREVVEIQAYADTPVMHDGNLIATVKAGSSCKFIWLGTSWKLRQYDAEAVEITSAPIVITETERATQAAGPSSVVYVSSLTTFADYVTVDSIFTDYSGSLPVVFLDMTAKQVLTNSTGYQRFVNKDTSQVIVLVKYAINGSTRHTGIYPGGDVVITFNGDSNVNCNVIKKGATRSYFIKFGGFTPQHFLPELDLITSANTRRLTVKFPLPDYDGQVFNVNALWEGSVVILAPGDGTGTMNGVAVPTRTNISSPRSLSFVAKGTNWELTENTQFVDTNPIKISTTVSTNLFNGAAATTILPNTINLLTFVETSSGEVILPDTGNFGVPVVIKLLAGNGTKDTNLTISSPVKPIVIKNPNGHSQQIGDTLLVKDRNAILTFDYDGSSWQLDYNLDNTSVKSVVCSLPGVNYLFPGKINICDNTTNEVNARYYLPVNANENDEVIIRALDNPAVIMTEGLPTGFYPKLAPNSTLRMVYINGAWAIRPIAGEAPNLVVTEYICDDTDLVGESTSSIFDNEKLTVTGIDILVKSAFTADYDEYRIFAVNLSQFDTVHYGYKKITNDADSNVILHVYLLMDDDWTKKSFFVYPGGSVYCLYDSTTVDPTFVEIKAGKLVQAKRSGDQTGTASIAPGLIEGILPADTQINRTLDAPQFEGQSFEILIERPDVIFSLTNYSAIVTPDITYPAYGTIKYKIPGRWKFVGKGGTWHQEEFTRLEHPITAGKAGYVEVIAGELSLNPVGRIRTYFGLTTGNFTITDGSFEKAETYDMVTYFISSTAESTTITFPPSWRRNDGGGLSAQGNTFSGMTINQTAVIRFETDGVNFYYTILAHSSR